MSVAKGTAGLCGRWRPHCASIGAGLAVISVLAATATAGTGGGLKTIDNPAGGQLVYGPIDGETAVPGAMGVMLRAVHGHFGDRPQVGKLFQTRGTNSVATFFTVTAKNEGGRKVAGLVIVSAAPGSTPLGAVLYDQADRFAKTEPDLMRKLNDAWRQDAPAPPPPGPSVPAAGSSAGRENPPQPLRTAQLQDGSATVGLPAGWKITGGGGGAIEATGPHDEVMILGEIFQNNYDPRVPQSRGMLQYLSKGKVPYTACPYPGDLVAGYTCVINQTRQRRGLPPLSISILNRERMQAGQFTTQAELVTAELDRHDGKGPMIASLQVGTMRMNPSGGWALTLSGALAPKALADAEWSTLKAIYASYRQNGQVIANQTARVIADIHARGAANTKLAEARSAANDAHNASVRAQWDEQDRQSKVFQNYTLDRATIRDTEQNAHGTFTYGTADALVKANPNRFEYVPNQELLKGVDY